MALISKMLAPLSLCLLVASTAGCVAGFRYGGEIRAVPSPVLELSWVRAKRTAAGLAIRGQIQQVNCCVREVSGHIHFKVIGPNGATLAEKDTQWGDFIARQLHSASFKTVLPVPRQASVSAIEIQFVTAELR